MFIVSAVYVLNACWYVWGVLVQTSIITALSVNVQQDMRTVSNTVYLKLIIPQLNCQLFRICQVSEVTGALSCGVSTPGKGTDGPSKWPASPIPFTITLLPTSDIVDVFFKYWTFLSYFLDRSSELQNREIFCRWLPCWLFSVSMVYGFISGQWDLKMASVIGCDALKYYHEASGYSGFAYKLMYFLASSTICSCVWVYYSPKQ